MSYTVVQTNFGTSGATTVANQTAAFGSNNTAGNFLVCIADGEWGGGLPALTISDTAGNTRWTQLVETDPDVSDTAAWYCWNCLGGANTVKVTSGVGNINIGMIIREYSGVQNTSDPLDQKASGSGSSTAITSGASAATTNATDLVVGYATSEHPGETFTLGSGYSNLSVENDANLPHEALAIEDLATASTGAQTATFTGNTSSNFVCGVAAFKLAGASTEDAQAYELAILGIG